MHSKMLQLATDKSKTLLSCPSSNPPTASIIERPEKWATKRNSATGMHLPICSCRKEGGKRNASSKMPQALQCPSGSSTLQTPSRSFADPQARRHSVSTAAEICSINFIGMHHPSLSRACLLSGIGALASRHNCFNSLNNSRFGWIFRSLGILVYK